MKDQHKMAAVPKHEAKKVLTSKYLENLELSVKDRTPLAGTNIAVLAVEGGAIISVTGGLAAVAGDPVILTVCSNGQPTVVTVVGYSA